MHCQVGAQRLAFARIYNWLGDTLASSDPGTGASDANR